jgi:hypothetical protein
MATWLYCDVMENKGVLLFWITADPSFGFATLLQFRLHVRGVTYIFFYAVDVFRSIVPFPGLGFVWVGVAWVRTCI